MSDDVFQRYSAYYDLLYKTKDYTAEAEYIGRTLQSVSPASRTLLEFGSGTGKHGRLLAALGFQVVGVERSATMVAASAASTSEDSATSSGSFECRQGDIRTVEIDQTFDAVCSLFHVVSYLTRNEDVLQTFANAARHLRSGGVFLFDVWHGPAVLSERPAVRVKRVENETVELTRIAEPELNTDANVVTVRYTMLAVTKADERLTRFGEVHHMRYFFPVEVESFAAQTGFVVERSEEFLSGAPRSEKTWGVAYLLRKR